MLLLTLLCLLLVPELRVSVCAIMLLPMPSLVCVPLARGSRPFHGVGAGLTLKLLER